MLGLENMFLLGSAYPGTKVFGWFKMAKWREPVIAADSSRCRDCMPPKIDSEALDTQSSVMDTGTRPYQRPKRRKVIIIIANTGEVSTKVRTWSNLCNVLAPIVSLGWRGTAYRHPVSRS